MTETKTDPAIDALFAGKEAAVLTTYLRLRDRVGAFGPFREELQQASIHFERATAFASIQPQRRALLLTLRTEKPIDSPRVVRSEQDSPNRYHNELRLTSPNEVDAELNGWLRGAYKLG